MQTQSILRIHEYQKISSLSLSGKVLDLGGNKNASYQKLFNGNPEWITVNISGDTDFMFDVQNKFPLNDNCFDNAISMNLLEHVFEYQNIFSEVSRILKPGGLFISTVPFMYKIHASPDDFHRYTKSTYLKVAEKYGFEVLIIEPLGYGIFSLIHQILVGWIPTSILKKITRKISVFLDEILLNFSKYQKMRNEIPLGYFWVMKKK